VSCLFSTRPAAELFAAQNRFAWCIVPFDAAKRTPEQRAAMLQRLGISGLAYDWRAEHIATFEQEILACQTHGITLTAWWVPGGLDATAHTILALLEKHKIRTQLWVMVAGSPAGDEVTKIANEVRRLRPIAEAAARINCTVALYNHGGWLGEPATQVAIVKQLQASGITNVGIVYNQHHGHAHVDDFTEQLLLLKPYLYALNLNGMERDGDKKGNKIMPIGQGELDLGLLRIIQASGWKGPIGILNHTNADAEARLADNAAGLDWLVKQLGGETTTAKPVPTSWKRAP
jgi:sugar phosphate isomerase/epimerase